MNFDQYAPMANKLLHRDGSVTTLSGEPIEPPDERRAALYHSMSPVAAKYLLPNGTILEGITVSAPEGGHGGNADEFNALLAAETDARIGGDDARYTKAETYSRVEIESKLYVERAFQTARSLVAETPIELALPTSVIAGLSPKVFVNGLLAAWDTTRLTVSGNKVIFIPGQSAADAAITVFYATPTGEMPKDISEVSVDFEIDEPDTTIANAVFINSKLANAVVHIDWGDGTNEDAATDETLAVNVPHTYANPGTYTVNITEDYGLMTYCRFYTQSVKVVKGIRKVKGNGFVGLGNMFANQPKLTEFAPGFRFETPNVVNANNMFLSCTALTDVPADMLALCPQITTIAGHFDKCSSLVTIPEGYFANQKEVTTANVLCRQCTSMTSIPTGLFRGMAKLANVSSCFTGCAALQTMPDEVLKGCAALTSTVSMFEGCASLENIAPDILRDCVALETATSMFYKCTKLTTVPNGLLSGCPNLTDASAFFRNCAGLQSLPGDFFASNPKVTKLGLFLNGGTALTAIGDGFFDPLAESLTELGTAFHSCTSFTSNINALFRVPMTKLTTMTSTFYGCNKLTGSGLAAIAQFVPAPTTTSGCFKNCSALSDFASIPATWK